MDLYLFDITEEKVLIATSESNIDNTENIWEELEPNRKYSLQVTVNKDQKAFEWDYALAWQITDMNNAIKTSSNEFSE